MLNPTTIEAQYEDAVTDDLRVLVVGAGIAGVTIAQLLRRAGRHPVLIERGDDTSAPGYMLALMPMVDAALDDLGVRERYGASSVSLERYGVRGHTGRMLRVDTMARLLAQFGDYRGIARGELIDVLTDDEAPVTFHSTVAELIEEPDAVRVSVSVAGVPHWLEFDLVVIADGLHSQTRDLVLCGRPVEVVDTKWGGWVAWAPGDGESDLGEEVWGAGFFVGLYPVKGELGVFVGGPRTDSAHGASAFVAGIRRRLETVPPRLDRALTAVADDPDSFYWSLTDCRAPTWTTGRTVLLGDAAAGFLPTAGIGAGMAMESAWLLGRLLSRADPGRLADVLKSYERVQRPRVESAQRNSRQLATMMFRRSRMLAYLREIALRAVSVERAIRPIQRLLQDRRDPDAVIGAMRSDRADH